MPKRSHFLSKSPKAGRTTLTPDQAKRFVEIYCVSLTYVEVADKLGRDVNEVMHVAQIMRANGIALPYLKIHNEVDEKVVNSKPPKGFQLND